MDERKSNGLLQCGGVYEWEEHRQDIDKLKEDVRDMKTLIIEMHDSNSHLVSISETLVEIKNGLLAAVLNKDSTPLSVTKELLEGQRKGYQGIIKVLCTTFGVVLIALVGLKYAAPHIFN